jgi:hypothetical protein
LHIEVPLQLFEDEAVKIKDDINFALSEWKEVQLMFHANKTGK